MAWYEEEPTYIRDYTVNGAACVAYPPLAGRELTEVGGRLGTDVVEEAEDDAPGMLAVDGDVKLVERER